MIERISLYFGAFMLLVYLGTGIFLLAVPRVTALWISNFTVRISVGIGIILYGLVRGYLIFQQFKRQKEDEDDEV